MDRLRISVTASRNNAAAGVVGRDRRPEPMILLFAESGILSPYIEAALTLWPVWAAIAAAAFVLWKFRIFEKRGIHETNQANIESLEKLLATRDKELAQLNSAFALLTKESETTCDELTKENETLKAEYKALAGLNISELLHWAGRFEFHLAEVAAKDSEIRILKTRIDIMERREGERIEGNI